MRFLLAVLLACAATLASAQQLRPWTGGATPPLALQDLQGRTHALEDYRGKVVLINFWATWCGPCREEMPSINQLRAALAGQPFAVLAVNLGETEPRIRRFLEQVPLDFTVLLDRDSAAGKAWRARVLPMSFLVGPDGRVRYAVVGEYDWTQDAARKAILALLPAGGPATRPRAGASYSASSGTLSFVPLTTMPPRSPGVTLP
jgi:thiol-disulfide isomerase/thioredoxin